MDPLAKEEHIPEVMSSGQFSDYKFFRLLEQDETDGVTYIIQYFSSTFIIIINILMSLQNF